jgi:hypothetical protein
MTPRLDGFVMEAFPNPVIDGTADLTVRIRGMITGEAQIALLDATGKVLGHAVLNGAEAQVEVGGLPAGHYFIRYTDGARSEV